MYFCISPKHIQPVFLAVAFGFLKKRCQNMDLGCQKVNVVFSIKISGFKKIKFAFDFGDRFPLCTHPGNDWYTHLYLEKLEGHKLRNGRMQKRPRGDAMCDNARWSRGARVFLTFLPYLRSVKGICAANSPSRLLYDCSQ
jgi:hypothetical protein